MHKMSKIRWRLGQPHWGILQHFFRPPSWIQREGEGAGRDREKKNGGGRGEEEKERKRKEWREKKGRGGGKEEGSSLIWCNVSRSDYLCKASPSRHLGLWVTWPGLRICWPWIDLASLLDWRHHCLPACFCLSVCLSVCVSAYICRYLCLCSKQVLSAIFTYLQRWLQWLHQCCFHWRMLTFF